MFGFLRLIFWSMIFTIIFIIEFLKKKNNFDFKRISRFVLLFIVLVTFSGFVPIENIFITFSSPEQSYNYCDNSSLEYVIEGKQSAMVISEDKDCLIIPKGENGWKIGMGADTRTINQLIYDGLWCFIMKHDKTEDYYLIIYGVEKIINISDSMGTVFNLSEDSKFGYAYIENYKEPYNVVVNGKSLEIGTMKDRGRLACEDRGTVSVKTQPVTPDCPAIQ